MKRSSRRWKKKKVPDALEVAAQEDEEAEARQKSKSCISKFYFFLRLLS